MRRRIVVTGIGAITPIGIGVDGLWCGVCMGRRAPRRVTRFDPDQFRSQVAAEIDDFEPGRWMNAHAVRRLDRFAQLGVAASVQALDDAEIGLGDHDAQRSGVSLGSALGGVAFGEEQHDVFRERGIKAISPSVATAVYGGASGANIAIELGLRGPNLANANSCASGAIAIGEAARIIERGDADLMLAGGAEAPLAPLTFGSFALIRAMSTRNHDPSGASRPFDQDRDGFVMAEGSAMLVLEDAERARARGARVYCELLGYGHTNDAYHMTAPRPDGGEAARAVEMALSDARLLPRQIDYVNAHATGTPLGDAAECRALHRALGGSGTTVPVSGTKGLYGHALGASGAIEAAIVALAFQRHFMPGNANLCRRADDCDVTLVPPSGRRARLSHVLSTSFGFGGANSALVFGRAPAGL